jgi:hypothetical protein
LNTANVSGSIITSTGVSAQVLTRKAEVMEDMDDIDLTGNANTYVLRYNKTDDTYKADKRNLDGGSF